MLTDRLSWRAYRGYHDGKCGKNATLKLVFHSFNLYCNDSNTRATLSNVGKFSRSKSLKNHTQVVVYDLHKMWNEAISRRTLLVQWRQRCVPKSGLGMQSCCFVIKIKNTAFLKILFPSLLWRLKLLNFVV